MTLGDKQRLFAQLYAKLILKAYAMGYEVTLGETLRWKSTAKAHAKKGRGITESLHLIKLAGDLNLFKNGKYLRSTEAHRPLGMWWKKQFPLCRWGGDFRRPDGNHYSIAHGGRA